MNEIIQLIMDLSMTIGFLLGIALTMIVLVALNLIEKEKRTKKEKVIRMINNRRPISEIREVLH